MDKLAAKSSLKNKNNNTSEVLKQIPTEVVEKDLDNVLETVKRIDVTCDYSKCKAKTNLMGQHCDYCSKDYCFKHGLPEVHGCGEAVKRDERKKFVQQKPMKVVRQEEDLAKAKKRLEAKLKDMKVSRMPKPPSKKK